MSKKHFETIAAALKLEKPSTHDTDCFVQWRGDVLAMADVCCMFNDNFDRSRFLSACGYED